MATAKAYRRQSDLARLALARSGYSTDDESVRNFLRKVDALPPDERRDYLLAMGRLAEPSAGPAPAAAAASPPAAAPAAVAAAPPAAALPAGPGPGPGPVPVAAGVPELDPGAPVAMVPREPMPAPAPEENLFGTVLGGGGDMASRMAASFLQSAVMPAEGVGALGLRAAGQDPALAGAGSGALEAMLPAHVQEARRATGEVLGRARFTRAGLAAVGRRLYEDPQAIGDIVAGAAGFLIPMGAAGRLLKLIPLARANPRIAATAGEAIVAGAASLPELAENDEISLGRVVAGAVGTALATGAVSGAGRLVGGAQIEDIVSKVGPHTGRRALRTVAGELVEEAVEESAQTAVGNVAQDDPIGQGLGGAAAAGMIGGGAMGSAAAFMARTRADAGREFLQPSRERAERPLEPSEPAEAPQPAPEPERPAEPQPAAPEVEAAQPAPEVQDAEVDVRPEEGRQVEAEAEAEEDAVAEPAPAPEPSPEPAPAPEPAPEPKPKRKRRPRPKPKPAPEPEPAPAPAPEPAPALTPAEESARLEAEAIAEADAWFGEPLSADAPLPDFLRPDPAPPEPAPAPAPRAETTEEAYARVEAESAAEAEAWFGEPLPADAPLPDFLLPEPEPEPEQPALSGFSVSRGADGLYSVTIEGERSPRLGTFGTAEAAREFGAAEAARQRAEAEAEADREMVRRAQAAAAEPEPEEAVTEPATAADVAVVRSPSDRNRWLLEVAGEPFRGSFRTEREAMAFAQAADRVLREGAKGVPAPRRTDAGTLVFTGKEGDVGWEVRERDGNWIANIAGDAAMVEDDALRDDEHPYGRPVGIEHPTRRAAIEWSRIYAAGLDAERKWQAAHPAPTATQRYAQGLDAAVERGWESVKNILDNAAAMDDLDNFWSSNLLRSDDRPGAKKVGRQWAPTLGGKFIHEDGRAHLLKTKREATAQATEVSEAINRWRDAYQRLKPPPPERTSEELIEESRRPVAEGGRGVVETVVETIRGREVTILPRQEPLPGQGLHGRPKMAPPHEWTAHVEGVDGEGRYKTLRGARNWAARQIAKLEGPEPPPAPAGAETPLEFHRRLKRRPRGGTTLEGVAGGGERVTYFPGTPDEFQSPVFADFRARMAWEEEQFGPSKARRSTYGGRPPDELEYSTDNRDYEWGDDGKQHFMLVRGARKAPPPPGRKTSKGWIPTLGGVDVYTEQPYQTRRGAESRAREEAAKELEERLARVNAEVARQDEAAGRTTAAQEDRAEQERANAIYRARQSGEKPMAARVRDDEEGARERTPADIDTPEFRRWFGDSKVVDDDGKPMAVYHSGQFDEEIDPVPWTAPGGGVEFGMHFGTARASAKRWYDVGFARELDEDLEAKQGVGGKWFWFFQEDYYQQDAEFEERIKAERQFNEEKAAADRDRARKMADDEWTEDDESDYEFSFGEDAEPWHLEGPEGYDTKEEALAAGREKVADYEGHAGAHLVTEGDMPDDVTRAYLRIENPFEMQDPREWTPREVVAQMEYADELSEEARKASKAVLRSIKDDAGMLRDLIGILQREGFDGIRYENMVEDAGSESWIVFEPQQVKSVYNVGTFSESPSVLAARARGEVVGADPYPVDVDLSDRNELAWYEGLVREGGRVPDGVRILNRPAGVPAPNTWDVLPDDDYVRGRAARARAEREAQIDQVVADVQAAAARILPATARVKVDRGAYVDAPHFGTARGLYWPGGLVQVAARSEDPSATLRHESIHALKRLGFITPSEWRRLERAAEKGKWAEKHDIDEIYGAFDLTPEQLAEEAVAKEFESWWQDQQEARAHEAPGVAARIWRRIRVLLTALADRVWPRSPAALWRAIERGDVARRRPRAVAETGAPMAARPRDPDRGGELEAWELDAKRKRRATAGKGTPQRIGAKQPALPEWANTEMVQASRAIAAGVRPLLSDAEDRSFVGPGGQRIDVDDLDNPIKVARVLTRNIGHLPGWLSDLREHVDDVRRFPRGNTLQLIRSVNLGIDRARRKAAAKAQKAGGKEALKALNAEARAFARKWTKGRPDLTVDAAWKDVASALIVDPLRLTEQAPGVVQAVWAHADDSRPFADAVHALQRETSSSEARNAIQFVDELLERGWQAGAERPSERLIAEASARAWAAANPYEAWSLSGMKDLFAAVRTSAFDRTGGLRRFDRLSEQHGSAINNAAAKARELAYVNADPVVRRLFGPVVDDVQALGGTAAKPVNDYLIAARILQGDPVYEADASGRKRIVFDRSKAGPGGMNPETARAAMNRIRQELGPEGRKRLDRIVERVRGINKWLTAHAEGHGLLTPEAAALYRQSPAYVPFSLVDYSDPFNQRAGFMRRGGSTGFVNRVLPELGEKVRATLIAAARNEAIKTVVKQQVALKAAGETNVVPLDESAVDWTADGLRLTPRAAKRLEGELGRGHRVADWAPLQYSEAGKRQVFAVERIVADAFHRYGDPGKIVKFGRAMNTLSRTLILRADPLWLLWDNPVMDFARGWLALHGARPAGRGAGALRGTLAYAKDWAQSWAVAAGRAKSPFKRAGMKPHDLALLEAMQDARILPEDALVEGEFAEQDAARGRAGRVLDEALGHGTGQALQDRAEEIAAARAAGAAGEVAGFLQFAAAFGRAVWGHPIRTGADRFLDRAMMISETPSKRAAALHYAREALAKKTGRRPSSFSRSDPAVIDAVRRMPRPVADFIRTSIGSPDFYLGGTAQAPVQAAFQFLSPSANAMSADAAVAARARTRAGWWTKLMLLAAWPIGATIVKHLDIPEDDEELAPLRTLSDRLKAIPRWRLWSDWVIPAGETGAGRTISVTGPIEHSVRLPLSLFLLALDTALRKEPGTATGVFEEGMSDVVKSLPGLSWWIPAAGASLRLLTGEPYIDPFRGRAIMSRDELEATTTGQRMLRALGYGLASVGVRNPDLVMSVDPIRKTGEGNLERLLRVPWIGKVARRGLVVDDAGLRETAEQAARPEARAAARAQIARRQALADAARIYREEGRRDYARIGREFFREHEGAVPDTAGARIRFYRMMRAAAEVFPGRPGAVDTLAYGTDAEAAAAARGLILDAGLSPRAVRRAANMMFAGSEGRGGSMRRLAAIHRAIREAQANDGD